MGLIKKLKMPVWNIGFIEKRKEDILKEKEYQIVWMKHSYPDRFFADPFLLEETGEQYIILAEECMLVEHKGKIVRLTVEKKTKKLVKREKLIETDCHLSFPFIYRDSVIPEQSAGNVLAVYDFNGEKKKRIAPYPFIDSVILEEGTQKWIFTTRESQEHEDVKKKLYRYMIKEGQVNMESEILIADRYESSRMAGAFFEISGKIYRPAQNSTETFYGESVSINEVIQNDNEGYREIFIKNFNSHKEKLFNEGLHTFNVYDNITIVDGCKWILHPLRKVGFKVRLCLHGKIFRKK